MGKTRTEKRLAACASRIDEAGALMADAWLTTLEDALDTALTPAAPEPEPFVHCQPAYDSPERVAKREGWKLGFGEGKRIGRESLIAEITDPAICTPAELVAWVADVQRRTREDERKCIVRERKNPAHQILDGLWAQREATLKRNGKEPVVLGITAAALDEVRRDQLSLSNMRSSFGNFGPQNMMFGVPLAVIG